MIFGQDFSSSREYGYVINHKKVQRIMKELDLKCVNSFVNLVRKIKTYPQSSVSI
ncbi:hypothetical protein B1B04_25090 [Lysinibacillus sp. KCTC 33748]|uniref:IS3 family transposase n=1 Tax=Lysinibacillus sp. AC-3 TaxID=1680467 RepID=UPI0009A61745|nr:hypothetical protein B1B04_25090 [Lysinibacillus sp. KCTC 33748]